MRLLLLLLLAGGSLSAGSVSVFDVIPASMSAEAEQNSEPSLAINPAHPSQIVLGAFGSTGTGYFFSTLNAGSAWTLADSFPIFDKTLAYSRDGQTLYTSFIDDSFAIGLKANGALIDSYPVGDMPWVVTGAAGRIYIGFNNTDEAVNGASAMVRVSTDRGASFSNTVIDRVGAPDYDNPAVRVAANGDRVYAAFIRFNSVISTLPDNTYRNAEVVVVRDDQGATGASKFSVLGASGAGTVVVDVPWIDDFSGIQANNRIGADLSLAVDPHNPDRVLIAYQSSPSPTISNLVVSESLDGGAHWTTRTTLSAQSSALPALSILDDGTVGLLYETENLGFAEPHFLVTRNDFANFTDTVLAHSDKAIVPVEFQPYLGDYFDLQSAGLTFAGTFAAPTIDDGTLGVFPNGVTFLRSYSGAPGTPSFALNDGLGNPVANSIDPFFFTQTLDPVPEPGTLALTAAALALLCRRRTRPNRAATVMERLPALTETTGPPWRGDATPAV
jgi:hypothetical protein